MIFSLARNFLATYSWENKQFPCHPSGRNTLGDLKNPIFNIDDLHNFQNFADD